MEEKIKKKRTVRRGYWIEYFLEECVLCGRQESHRVYHYDDPKPADPFKRYHFKEFACGHHFC